MKILIKYNLFVEEGSWRFQAWVAEAADDVDTAIFVHQRSPLIPHEDETVDKFVDIAGVADMVEYPVDSPEPPLSFFRKSCMDIKMSDSSELERAINSIRLAIDRLMRIQ